MDPLHLNRRVIFGFAALAALLAASLWFFLRSPAVDRSHVYKIGYGQDAPMHFKGEDGRPAGLAVELVQEAARRSGIQLEWVEADGLRFQEAGLDLWVLLTILPERLKTTHFSEAYLQTQSCLLVRAESRFHELEDLAHARVSYNRHIVVRNALTQLLPDAEAVAAPSSDAAVAALNDGQVDAALVDEYLVITGSLAGSPHAPFRLLPTRSPKRFLAIGSTFAAAAVADELRHTMQVMADRGELAHVINRWTFFANPVTGTIDELAATKRRERGLALGLAALLVVTSLTIGLAFRSYRQAVRLRRTENFLREIADRVPGVVYQYRLNPDGTACLPYASEALRQIFRVDPAAVRTDAAPVLAAVHPDDRGPLQVAIQRSARELTPWVHEYRLRLADGTVRWLTSNAVPHREPGGAIVWHGVSTDVTERKMAEASLQAFERKLQETQKLESLGVLAGGIAHDFNNLLTSILGNANLASLAVPPDSPLHAHLEPIKRGSLRAAELCKQLLAYSGKGRLLVGKVDLHALLDETMELLRHAISKQCELRFNRAAHLPPVEGDATQLRQVIMNLVINASEAIGAANGVITITTRLVTLAAGDAAALDAPAGPYLSLEVADNGCGMSAETLRKIFDPFFTTKFTGRGLGLAAVHGIVRGHRGVLQVESAPGRGTTFRLLFPPAEGAADPVVPPRAVSGSWRGTGCVLVVDDEETVRQIATMMLRKLGFEVVLAVDGQEAVEIFAADPARFDLVLLDLTMPRLDGRQVFRELRRRRGDVRVVVMSGFNEEEVVPEFAGDKLAGFLQKPFEYDTFCTVLQRATGA